MVRIAGVIHGPTPEELEEAIRRVKPLFVQGATLWVEHVRLYPEIVQEAKKARMKVKSLDSKYAVRLLKKASRSGNSLMDAYIDYEVRERSWLPRIKHCSQKDLVVMFPIHAKRVCKALSLPSSAFVYMQTLSNWWKNRAIRPLNPKQLKLLQAYLKTARKKANIDRGAKREATWVKSNRFKLRKSIRSI